MAPFRKAIQNTYGMTRQSYDAMILEVALVPFGNELEPDTDFIVRSIIESPEYSVFEKDVTDMVLKLKLSTTTIKTPKVLA